MDRPAYYAERVLGGGRDEGYVKEYTFGSAVHAGWLEDWAGIAVTDFDTRSNDFKRLRQTSDAIVVPRPLYERALRAVEALQKSPVAKAIWPQPGAETEVSFQWTDEETGIDLRVRYDIYAPHFTADLKTSHNPRPYSFRQKFFDLRYDIQAGLYLMAQRLLGHKGDYHYVVVGSEAPHEVFTYRVAPDEAEFHVETVRCVLRALTECRVASGECPDKWYEPWQAETILSILPTYQEGADSERE